MKNYSLPALFIICLCTISEAETITGKLIDGNGQPLPYATAILKNSADSAFIKGELTNESGEFIMQNINPGKYFIQFQSAGYSAFTKPGIEISAGSNINIGDIKLESKALELKGVTIEGEKPFIERQADKMVVNVENSIIQAGSTVMEVFEKLPGVIVDQDGNIRLRGKQGVIVYIDDKPAVLSGQDLINMLKGMSASTIQKVEIMVNPSAKWDASGNAGILNIITKKNRRDGFNGSVGFTYGQGRYSKYSASTSVNYKKDRLNLFFNYGYSGRHGFNNLLIDRKFYEEGQLVQRFLTNNYLRLPFLTHNPRLGVDYNLTEKTTVSLLTSAFISEFNPTTDNHSDIFGPANEKSNSLDFNQDAEFHSHNYEFNTQINHKFDTTGQSLVINLDYGQYDNNSDQNFTTLSTDFVNDTAYNIYLYSHQLGDLKLYSVKADYSKPLKNNFSLEAGAKSSLVKSDADMQFFDVQDGVDIFNTARSSHFLYNENINAGYVSLTKKIKTLTIQSGLRGEQTVADGLQKLNNQSFKRNYFQIFPTLYVNYEFGKNNVNANLGRRINRPGYGQMNPFRRLIDYTTYSEGNPYLLPELTYVTELSYSHDNTYFVTLNYSQTSQSITDILIQDLQSRTTIQSIVNLNKLNYYSIDLSYTKRIINGWKTNTDLLIYYSHFDGVVNNYRINQGDPSFSVNSTNNININENLSAEISVRYNYKNLYNVTLMKSDLNVSAGIQQSLFSKKAVLTINMTDILWTAWPRGFTDFGNVTEKWESKRDTRVLNIGLTYNFGKGKVARMRRNTGADEEKGRVG